VKVLESLGGRTLYIGLAAKASIKGATSLPVQVRFSDGLHFYEGVDYRWARATAVCINVRRYGDLYR
jgi:hypothetical protein